MIATLPMYDWPDQSLHWDAFWSQLRDGFRAHGLNAPDRLTRGGSLWDHWENPELILGQACGLPYRTRLHGKVTLLGAIDHGLPGAPPGHYYSVLVAHRDTEGAFADFHNKTLAYNDPHSQSGWAAAQTHGASHGFVFTKTLRTGSHAESARAVAQNRADIAALDAETWRLIQCFVPDVAELLRIVDTTPPTPGLPLITGPGIERELAQEVIDTALASTAPDTRAALHIKGFARLEADAYLSVPTPAGPTDMRPSSE